MWEALEVPAGEACRSATRAERYQLKKDKIGEAQDRGLMRKDMPPAMFLMMLMGMVNYATAVEPVRQLVFGDEFGPDDYRRWLKDAVKRIAAHARDDEA
jgi:hypothetical protein